MVSEWLIYTRKINEKLLSEHYQLCVVPNKKKPWKMIKNVFNTNRWLDHKLDRWLDSIKEYKKKEKNFFLIFARGKK